MQKKNEDIDGYKLLVIMVETETKVPKTQAPPSPKNIWALGKLNFIKTAAIKHRLNKIYAKS